MNAESAGVRPLIVAPRFDRPLRDLVARGLPVDDIVVVDERAHVAAAAARIAHALLRGRPVRRRRTASQSGSWVDEAIAQGGAVFAQAAGTLRERSLEWLQNIVSGLDVAPGLPPVSSLEHAAEGLEALVVGSGPSLDRLGDRLPALARGRLVIAAGSALRSVQGLGVEPQVTLLIEGSDCSVQLAPPATLSRTIIVVAQHGHPANAVPGSRGLVRADLVENAWYAEWLGSGPPLASGGNVGTSAVALALRLGCRRVLLAGLDFAWAARGTHAQGVRRGEFVPDALPEDRAWGFAADDVPTDALLTSYRVSLEAFIAANSASGTQFVHVADEGCARIRGTERFDGSSTACARSAAEEPNERLEAAMRSALARHEPPGRAVLRERLIVMTRAACARLKTLEACLADGAPRSEIICALADAPGSLENVIAYGHVALAGTREADVLQRQRRLLDAWGARMSMRLEELE